jgi:hypothetical protein
MLALLHQDWLQWPATGKVKAEKVKKIKIKEVKEVKIKAQVQLKIKAQVKGIKRV